MKRICLQLPWRYNIYADIYAVETYSDDHYANVQKRCAFNQDYRVAWDVRLCCLMQGMSQHAREYFGIQRGTLEVDTPKLPNMSGLVKKLKGLGSRRAGCDGIDGNERRNGMLMVATGIQAN